MQKSNIYFKSLLLILCYGLSFNGYGENYFELATLKSDTSKRKPAEEDIEKQDSSDYDNMQNIYDIFDCKANRAFGKQSSCSRHRIVREYCSKGMHDEIYNNFRGFISQNMEKIKKINGYHTDSTIESQKKKFTIQGAKNDVYKKMYECRIKIREKLQKQIKEATKLIEEKDLYNFIDDSELTAKKKKLIEFSENCKKNLDARYSKGPDALDVSSFVNTFSNLKNTIDNVASETECRDLQKKIDLYEKHVQEIEDKKNEMCKNTEINKEGKENCISKLYQLVNEDKTIYEGKEEETSLLARCVEDYDNHKSCCVDPLQEEKCSKDYKAFKDFLNGVDTQSCDKEENFIAENFFNEQKNFCNSNTATCYQACDEKIENLKNNLKSCFYKSREELEEIAASTEHVEGSCEEDIQAIFGKYETIAKKIYYEKSVKSPIKLKSKLTEDSKAADFMKCTIDEGDYDELTKDELTKRMGEQAKLYKKQICKKAKDSKDEEEGPGTATETDTGNPTDNTYTPSKTPRGTSGMLATSSTTDITKFTPSSNTGNEVKPWDNWGLKGGAKKDSNKKDGVQKGVTSTMENTGKETIDPKLSDNSPTNLQGGSPSVSNSNKQFGSSDGDGTESQSSLEKFKTKFLSLSSRSKSKRKNRRSYLDGFKRNLAANNRLAKLPIQSYKSRDSGANKNKQPIGTANQNIFEMISNSMNNFCNIKIKNCYGNI